MSAMFAVPGDEPTTPATNKRQREDEKTSFSATPLKRPFEDERTDFSATPSRRQKMSGDFDSPSSPQGPIAAAPGYVDSTLEPFQTIIPLPASDYDLTDLDGWRVAGSLGMMESEQLASKITRKIVNLTERWSALIEANPTVLPPRIREHNLRVLTDDMVALLHETSKGMYNLTKRGMITQWLEATLAIGKARSILRKT